MYKKNQLFIIGIIIGILVLSFMAIIPLIPKVQKYYIATDDITEWPAAEFRPSNETYLIAGRYEDGSSSSIGYSYLQFNLENKPNKWSSCEFSFYVFENEDSEGEAVWFGFIYCPNGWNETTISYDHSWHHPDDYITIEERTGLQRYNITSAIRNREENDKITIGVWGRNNYLYDPNYIKFYSKEANVSIDKLPQLIWS